MLSSEGNASCTAVDALGNPSRLGRHRKERHVANCRPNAGVHQRRPMIAPAAVWCNAMLGSPGTTPLYLGIMRRNAHQLLGVE